MSVETLFTESQPDLTPVKRWLTSAELPETDGVPLESQEHREDTSNLIDIVRFNIKTGCPEGNMYVYYDEVAGTDKSCGPDFFYVKNGDPSKSRRNWVVWEENGQLPELIVEFLSPSTAKRDRTTKKDLYEREFPTVEYFVFDYETHKFQGWRRNAITNQFAELTADQQGRFFCEVLNLFFGTWNGTMNGRHRIWPRLFHPDGKLALHPTEAAQKEAEAERRLKEKERRLKEEECRLKEEECRLKEEECRLKEEALELAAAERREKDAALQELALLREKLGS